MKRALVLIHLLLLPICAFASTKSIVSRARFEHPKKVVSLVIAASLKNYRNGQGVEFSKQVCDLLQPRKIPNRLISLSHPIDLSPAADTLAESDQQALLQTIEKESPSHILYMCLSATRDMTTGGGSHFMATGPRGAGMMVGGVATELEYVYRLTLRQHEDGQIIWKGKLTLRGLKLDDSDASGAAQVIVNQLATDGLL